MRAKQIFNPSTKNAKSGAILQTLILDSWKSKFHVITPDCMVPTVHVDPKVSRPIEMARGRDTGKDKDKYMDVHLYTHLYLYLHLYLWPFLLVDPFWGLRVRSGPYNQV